MAYIPGIHIDMEIPKTVRQNVVYMPFWIKEKGIGVWDFKGKGMQFTGRWKRIKVFGKQMFW